MVNAVAMKTANTMTMVVEVLVASMIDSVIAARLAIGTAAAGHRDQNRGLDSGYTSGSSQSSVGALAISQ
jgi:hypothetical protein